MVEVAGMAGYFQRPEVVCVDFRLAKTLAQLCTFASPGLRLCRHHWLKAQDKGENLIPITDRNRKLGRRKLGMGVLRVIGDFKSSCQNVEATCIPRVGCMLKKDLSSHLWMPFRFHP